MNLAEYFAKEHAKNPKPKFVYGDRVSAKTSGIPIVGMVIRENVEDKQVLVHSDLPLRIGRDIRTIVWVDTKTVKVRK